MASSAPSTTPLRDHGPLVAGIGLAALLVLVRVLSPGIPDSGDGVAHFQHARFAYSEPEAALSQWGKPVFTLLSAPFTTLGEWGTTAFNAVCAILACLLIMRFISDEQKRRWQWAVPLLLFAVPVFAQTVLGGLTEPLFGMLCVAVVLLIWHHRSAAAMALLSALPFARPEYAAFAPFAIAVVLWRREQRVLWWLLVGPALYILACAVLLGRPWDLFTLDTYAGKDIYGAGSAGHFVDQLDAIYGWPFLVVLAMAVVAQGALIWRVPGERERHLMFTALTFAPAVGILVLHSYAYAAGDMASLGLLRVMATTAPLLVLFMVHALAEAWARWVPRSTTTHLLFTAALLLFGNMAFHELRERVQMPAPEDEIQHTVRAAANWLRAHPLPDQHLVCEDPLIVALCEVDPWDTAAFIPLRGLPFMEKHGLRSGDRIVWDAHFAANEGGILLDTLLRDGRFELDTVFLPRTPTLVLGDRPYSIQVFHRIAGDWAPSDSLLFTLGTATPVLEGTGGVKDSVGLFTFGGEEFPLTLARLPLRADNDTRDALEVVLNATGNALAERKLLLVLEQVDEQGRPSFQHYGVVQGEQRMIVRVRPSSDMARTKLYLWNTSGAPFRLSGLRVSRLRLERMPGTEHRSSPR